jgi:hypothetical protein
MILTDDETDYIDQVVDRSRQLIRSGIWDVVRESRLDHWLGSLRNFGADLLAAYLIYVFALGISILLCWMHFLLVCPCRAQAALRRN